MSCPTVVVADVVAVLSTSTTAQHGPTRPHTIVQAVAAFRGGAARKQQQTSNHTAVAVPPIDLVAVVVNVQQQRATPSSSSKIPFCCLWICDASVPHTQNNNSNSNSNQQNHRTYAYACACRVLIFGRAKVRDIVQQLQVTRGDVMRFNRVLLQSDQQQDRMNFDYGNGTTVYTFKHSYQDPEPGLEYCRLFHIDPDRSDWELLQQHKQQHQHQQQGNTIPDSMRTDPTYLKTLLQWYRTTHLGSSSASAATTLLPPMPPQYRSLAELQFCQGVVSHVVALVLHIEETTSQQQQNSFTGNKRGRSSWHKSTSTLPVTTMYASLTDAKTITRDSSSQNFGGSCSSMMTLVLDGDCHIRMRTILREACDSKRPVRLQHVVSKRCGRNHTTPFARTLCDSDAGAVILQLTERTNLTLLESNRADQLYPCAPAAALSSTQSPPHQQQQQSTDDIIEIVSPLLNIQNSEGVSLQSLLANRDKLRSDPASLCRFVQCSTVTEPSSTFSWAATVQLRKQDCDHHDDDDRHLLVEARVDGPTVRALCIAGLDPVELLSSPDQARLAVDVMVGLVLEQVPLRWTLAVVVTLGCDNDGDNNVPFADHFKEPAHCSSVHPPGVVYRVRRVSLTRI